jgi:glycosyltransferase involved in cell wall biosynthesis
VRQALSAMDVFVLPSASEGNSNAVLEAMAAGLPVVSTRVGGTPMLVGPQGARFLVTPGDQEAIAARLLELINDEPLRKQVGAAMHQRVRERFDIDVVARTYAGAYSKLALGRRNEIGDASGSLILEG